MGLVLTKDGNAIRISTKDKKVVWLSVEDFFKAFSYDKNTGKVTIADPKIKIKDQSLGSVQIIADSNYNNFGSISDLGTAIAALTKIKTSGSFSGDYNDLTNLPNLPNYKEYIANLSQSGTNAPVAIVLRNTLGGTPVWTRNSGGNFNCTLEGAFVATKTSINIQNPYGSRLFAARVSSGPDVISLICYDVLSGPVFSQDDNILEGTITIRTFP